MIDDDWRPGEGDTMPTVWWRLADVVPLVVRHRSSRIPGLALVAFSDESHRPGVTGPLYLNLSRWTTCDPYHPQATAAALRTLNALRAAYPDTFSTVISTGPARAVWLALRLTRLRDPIADTLLALATTPTGSPSTPIPGGKP